MTYGEPPQCMTVIAVKAVKSHQCCECWAPIMPGEVYEKTTGVWDHCGQTFKTCWPCCEVRDQLTKDLRLMWQHDEGICFGHLQDELSEFCREIRP